MHLTADDVVGLSAFNGANGHHRRVKGRQGTADQGLQGSNNLSGNHNGVNAAFRVGTMTALALYRQANFIACAADKARLSKESPCLIVGIHVLSDDHIHMGILHASLLRHHFAAAHSFLFRLKEILYRAVPLILVGAQPHGTAQCQRHMGIVSAGMHGTFLCGGKGQTCFFRYRQRIHIRTNRHAGSFSVADQPHRRMAILEGMDFQS